MICLYPINEDVSILVLCILTWLNISLIGPSGLSSHNISTSRISTNGATWKSLNTVKTPTIIGICIGCQTLFATFLQISQKLLFVFHKWCIVIILLSNVSVFITYFIHNVFDSHSLLERTTLFFKFFPKLWFLFIWEILDVATVLTLSDFTVFWWHLLITLEIFCFLIISLSLINKLIMCIQSVVNQWGHQRSACLCSPL